MKNKRANGGVARANALTPERRQEIAQKAAKSRWDKNTPFAGEIQKQLTNAVRKADSKPSNKPAKQRKAKKPVDIHHELKKAWFEEYIPVAVSLRDEIACAVLTGLYSDIANAQKFAAHVMGPEMILPEAFTRIAYAQADEALRLRSL